MKRDLRQKSTVKRGVWLSIIVVATFTVIIFAVYKYVPTGDFRDSLIVELIGAGIVGLFIAVVMFYLQAFSEHSQELNLAEDDFYHRLIPNFAPCLMDGARSWDLSTGRDEHFYFDGGFINPIYDFCKKNETSLRRCLAVCDFNAIPSKVIDLIQRIEEAKVIGRKIDRIIQQRVRSFHHTNSIDAVNDGLQIAYQRAKLFTTISDEDLLRWIQHCGNEERRLMISNQLKQDVAFLEDLRLLQEHVKHLNASSETIKNEVLELYSGC